MLCELNKELIRTFTQNTNPENIGPMKAYMKGQYEYFGLKSPQRRALSKTYFDGIKGEPGFYQCVVELYDQPERELHYVAMEAFYKCRRNWDDNALKQIHWLITTNSWWDTVDFLASNCLGHFLSKDPELAARVAREWISSENMWVRRSALIFQLKYKDRLNQELLAYLISQTNHEKEFFIKKAIGWALRQHSRVYPEWVRHFVHNHELQPLSVREALKNI